MQASCDILIPLVTMNPSGGVRMVLHVANALAARGRRVAVSAPAGESPLALDARVTMIARARGRRAFVTSLPAARVYLATGYQTPLLIAVGRTLSAPRARIVHLIQGDEAASHVALGARPFWLRPLLLGVARAGYRVPAHRIAVSGFVAERVGAGRIHRVIPPGIEAEFAARPARTPHAGPLTAGVLCHPARAKGMAFALEAFGALQAHGNMDFVVFDGYHSVPLPDGVQPFSRSSTGRTLADFYRACDIFIFPSLVEGFGLPPLEAMACGAAVVVSDCGGVREYARDGENCLVVPPADAGAIAGAVRRLAGDDALRARITAAGCATAARFTAARFAQECVAEIETVLTGTRNS